MYEIYTENIECIRNIITRSIAKTERLEFSKEAAEDTCGIIMKGVLNGIPFNASLNRDHNKYTGQIWIDLPKSDKSEDKLVRFKKELDIFECKQEYIKKEE